MPSVPDPIHTTQSLAHIHGGFFIIIPFEYAATEMLPAEWFIDDLMSYIGRPFYVGLMSAAALHGAAHQQPQQFHVVTNGPSRSIRSKNRLAVIFFSKSGIIIIPVKSPETDLLISRRNAFVFPDFMILKTRAKILT